MHSWVLGGTGPSSDAGWGCMLRCGQMILGQALVCSHLGRGEQEDQDHSSLHSPHVCLQDIQWKDNVSKAGLGSLRT